MSQHSSRQPRESRKPSAAKPERAAERSRNPARPQRPAAGRAEAADTRGRPDRGEPRSKPAAQGGRGSRSSSAREQADTRQRPTGNERGGRSAGRAEGANRAETASRGGRGAGRPEAAGRAAGSRGERSGSPMRERAGEGAPRQRSSGGRTAPEDRQPRGRPEPRQAAAGKERYPQSDFARREGILENLPAVMVVNRSLKGYPFCKEFPWALRLVVAYRADETSGLPLPKEERVLEAFEQNLFGLLKKSVNGHYVGHTSWRGTREFLFYLDEGSEAEDPLNEFAERQKRELELALDSDPRWKHAEHYFDYRD